jgi:ribosomal protein S1
MIVDVFGIEAFLPGSQIDVKPIRDYDVCKQNNGIQRKSTTNLKRCCISQSAY